MTRPDSGRHRPAAALAPEQRRRPPRGRRPLRTVLAARVDALAPSWRWAGRAVRPVAAVITPLGWAVLVLGVGCWVLGWQFGWSELMVVAGACLLLVLASSVLLIGRSRLKVTLIADPQRVVVGAAAAGAVRVENTSGRPLLPVGVELPIGPTAARFTLPLLSGGAVHEELFVVPTQRRGVVVVGPALSVRGDPIGLLRRAVSWTKPIDVFVHPITVRLDSLGAGLLRDLEGHTTNELSMSDLAFHALREYQPGDDRRYIHWRSSAKAGRFLVRQFLDTRRSHVAVVVDSEYPSYGDADEFELAISAAASIAMQTVRDEQDVTVVVGEHAATGDRGPRVLDTFSRAELGTIRLPELARRTVRMTPGVSIAFVVTGPNTTFERLHAVAREFPVEARVIVVQIDPARPTSTRLANGLTLVSLQRLGDLALLVAAVAA